MKKYLLSVLSIFMMVNTFAQTCAQQYPNIDFNLIEDCNGNCIPAGWSGDNACDDGSFMYNISEEAYCQNFNPDGDYYCDYIADLSGYVTIYLNCEEANYDDGDCEPIPGCTDPEACNFNSNNATIEDGSCIYEGCTCEDYNLSLNVITTEDCNGNCAPASWIGDDDCDQFFVSHEMNGKLIRLTIPIAAEKMPIATNYSLQMAVTLCLDDNYVAVADPVSRQLMSLANRVAATDVTVFVNGPTGTGKEVLAKFIHNQSSRRDNAFVAGNCAAIPENMLEAILFGHEKGAFTGASTANKGIFRAADGGTLLLDEISEMPLSLQAKLLRALQERKVTPLGSQREVDVDVRVIATTNREMLSEISEGKFREDLFYRLNVFPLTTQHLAQRPDDIIPICSILLARHSPVLEDLPCIDD